MKRITVSKRKRGRHWYLFWTHLGRRYSRSVGPSQQIAEQLRRELEARLLLGDLSTLGTENGIPLFEDYGQTWLSQHAVISCK